MTAAEPIEARIRAAVKAGRLLPMRGDEQVASALAASVIDSGEELVLRRAKRLSDLVIQVDDFPQDLSVAVQKRHGLDAAPANLTPVRKAAA